MSLTRVKLLLAMGIIAAVHAGWGTAPCIACMTTWCPTAIESCSLAGIPAVVVACIAAVCGLACVGICTTILLGCFEGGNMVMTPAGPKRISDVMRGDLVLGVNDMYEEVLRIEYMPGEVEMVTATFDDASLTVTDNHFHYLLSEAGDVRPLQASDWAVGMRMVRQSKTADTKVTGVTRSTNQGKYYMSTSSCSVFANGVLTATACSNVSTPLYAHLVKLAKINMLRSADFDHDGDIELDEVEAFVGKAPRLVKRKHEQIKKDVVAADSNEDGFVDFAELSAEPLSEDEVGEEQKHIDLFSILANHFTPVDSAVDGGGHQFMQRITKLRQTAWRLADTTVDSHLTFDEFADYVHGLRFMLQGLLDEERSKTGKIAPQSILRAFDSSEGHLLSDDDIRLSIDMLAIEGIVSQHKTEL